jgi:hypothetical protein
LLGAGELELSGDFQLLHPFCKIFSLVFPAENNDTITIFSLLFFLVNELMRYFENA